MQLGRSYRFLAIDYRSAIWADHKLDLTQLASLHDVDEWMEAIPAADLLPAIASVKLM